MVTTPTPCHTGRRAVALGIAVMLLLAANTLEAAPPSRMVCGACEEPDRFVRLQVSPSPSLRESDSHFTHPFQLSPDAWTTLLQKIQVQPRSQGWFIFSAPRNPATPAFTADEIAYLSETLPRAFAQAQPEEWVVFGLSRARAPENAGIIEVTTGACFVKGTTLHLILSNYHEGVTMPAIRELLREDPLHMVAGPQYEFAPGPHQTMRQESTWLGAFLSPNPPELILAFHEALREEPELQTTEPTGSQSVIPSATRAPSSPETQPSLQERLKQLKRLKEQGLITDEDYQTKKKQLLDRL